MIRRVYSDLPKFKTLSFHEGLNLVLAEKSPGATQQQTRNSAGKSSLLEVLHFLLGSNADKKSLFKHPNLCGATFGMKFDLDGNAVNVERVGAKASKVEVAGLPSVRNGAGTVITLNDWKALLGQLAFGMGEKEGAWSPSFRSLIGYFIRRSASGGMDEPMKQISMQRTVDQQVNLSFLLGLDWTIPQSWQEVREREKGLEALRKGMKSGAFGSVLEKEATLRTRLIVAQDEVEKLKASLASFRVEAQYHAFEEEASTLTRTLATLADENTLDRRYLDELREVTVAEVAPAPNDLERLYREADITLPELVSRRYEDVAAFHESVVRNRRAYLDAEQLAARRRIDERGKEQRRLDARRSELMQILMSAGALEQFSALQSELTRREAALAELEEKRRTALALESGERRLTVDRAELEELLRRDHEEQQELVREAVLTFRDITIALYGTDGAGQLDIVPTADGPKFEPHLPGHRGTGVNHMRIYCFDMMLMILSLRRGRSPGVLVHDSYLFDAVEERQRATALELGAKLSSEYGFQYIVTMNTDSLPNSLPQGFTEKHALDVRLSDAREEGGLFGFRFD